LAQSSQEIAGKVNTVAIGATESEGGTRTRQVVIGGAVDIPFAERTKPNVALALEISDHEPEDWPEALTAALGDVVRDPAEWAAQAEEWGADLVCLHLEAAHPDAENISPDEAARTVCRVLEAMSLPLIIVGCGESAKDAEIMPALCEAAAGERCLIGCAVDTNYRTFSAVAQANGHALIAETPIDLNLAKQLNILIGDTGFPTTDIVIHHLTSALGYGLEYTYSIMERTRLAALQGDVFLSQPMVNFLGTETWRCKEVTTPIEEAPEWGDEHRRAEVWEASSAIAYICAGADLVVMRHPQALARVKAELNAG